MIKVDLVMWTFNGEKTLPQVLDRINKVIPERFVNNKFIVDDHSVDRTRVIAIAKGWSVLFNEGKGISDGANTSLRYVETKFFCSFEQDLLLSWDWWEKVVPVVLRDDVAASSGVRHQYPSTCMRKLHEYSIECYIKQNSELPAYLDMAGRVRSAMSWGRTLDNTIFKTEILRSIGGFPKLRTNGGVDTVLTYLFVMAGYNWPVNFGVVSRHLNKTFQNELRCQYNYGTCHDEIARFVSDLPVNLLGQVIRFFYSPLAAFRPALFKRCPEILFAYPLIRFNLLRGLLDSRKGKRWGNY